MPGGGRSEELQRGTLTSITVLERRGESLSLCGYPSTQIVTKIGCVPLTRHMLGQSS